MNRIAVIGSNSFSGASFCAHCLEQGFEVLGLSRSDEPINAFLPYRWLDAETRQRFQFTKADLNRDLGKMVSALKDFAPPYVVNFASQGMVAESWEAPGDWFQTNTVANIKLHDELRKMPFLEKFVHVSTPEVYGNCEGTIKEHTDYRPSTPYATSRAAADMSLMNFVENYDFPVALTRAANVFGPGQQLYRIIPRTILGIRLGEKLQLHGGGTSVRSFIHIDDVSRATLKIAQSAEPGEIFHLSTDRFVSIRELVELICEKMNAIFEENVAAAPERAGKDQAYLLDSTAIKRRFNWAPQIELENGIEETIAWTDAHFESIQNQPMHYIHKQ